MKNLKEPIIIGYLCNKENSIQIPLYEGINEIKSDIFKENNKFKFLQNLQFDLFKLNIQSINRAYLRSYEQFPLQLRFEKNNSIEEYFLCKSGIVTITSLYDLQIKVLNSKISFGKFHFEKNIPQRKDKNYVGIEIIDLLTPVSAETIDELSSKEKCNSYHLSSNCESEKNRSNLNNVSIESGETEEVVYTSRILESAEQFVKINLEREKDNSSSEIAKFNWDDKVINPKNKVNDEDVEANLKYNESCVDKSLISDKKEENFPNQTEIKPYQIDNYNVLVIPKKLLINQKNIFDLGSSNKIKNFIKIDPNNLRKNCSENPQKNKVISSYSLRKIENFQLNKGLFTKSNIDNENKTVLDDQELILRKRRREHLKKFMDKAESNLSTNYINNNNTSNSCMICLDVIKTPSKINTCGHIFCKECIDQWTNVSNSCPLCKKEFKKIFYYTDDNKILKERKVRKKKFKFEDEEENDAWIDQCLDHCMQCKQTNDVYLMLVCDKCHYNVCHTYCAGLDKIPEEDWFCSKCEYEKSQIQTRKEKKNKKLK